MPSDTASLEEAPKNRRHRINGETYILRGKERMWKGSYWGCKHGRNKNYCKECGGSAICEHGKRKYRCKECGGSSICKHGKVKYECKECGGSGICEHGKRKYECKECGGSAICEHGRIKYDCKKCGGSQICQHGRQKSSCRECGGSRICEHRKQRYHCKECRGSGICEHGKLKSQCKECGGSQICQHGRMRRYCKECEGSAICDHGKQKYKCKECRGSSICEHGKQIHQCRECRPIKRKTSDPDLDLEVIAVVKGNLPVKRPKIKKEKDVQEDVQLVEEVSRRPSRSKVIKIKNEDKPNGIIKCPHPECENGIVSNRGCNMVTCRNHKPNYFYFCFHCKTELPNGIQCSDCPSRIDADSQLDYLRTSMKVTIENGVINVS